MTQDDIDRLLQGRSIIDDYRAKDAQGIDESDKLAEKLKAIGFTSENPTQEFHDFNKALVTEAFIEMNIEGDCDFCVGYEGTPHCVEVWGSRACYNTHKDPRTTDGLYVGVLQGLLSSGRRGNDGASDNWEDTISHYEASVGSDGRFWFCPVGHGFYVDVKALRRKFRASGNPIGKFSLLWR